jgi:hypothetical protein
VTLAGSGSLGATEGDETSTAFSKAAAPLDTEKAKKAAEGSLIVRAWGKAKEP